MRTKKQLAKIDELVLQHVQVEFRTWLNKVARCVELPEEIESGIESGWSGPGVWNSPQRKAVLSRSLKRLQRAGKIDLVGRQGAWYWKLRVVR
jgi:hypothetical protein